MLLSSAVTTFFGSAVEFASYLFFCACALAAYSCHQVVQMLVPNKKTKRKPTTIATTRTKLIVISGCDRGLGLQMAKAWSQVKGYHVVALTLEDLQRKKFEGATNNTSSITSIKCDVTLDSDVQAMKEKVKQLLQDRNAVLYAIVNNAGIASPGDFVFHTNLDIPHRVMEVNYFGQLRVTQALLPLMICTSATFGGKIFNMSSVCGTSSTPGNSSYNASKFALEAWSDCLRVELHPFQIQVCKIRPGQMNTSLQTHFLKNMAQNYRNASEQIRNLYGNQAYIDNLRKFEDQFKERVSDPQLVVDTMTKLLVQHEGESTPLKSHYWIGKDANTAWKALWVLPTPVSGWIKSLLGVALAGPKLPPIDTVAHVTIRVRELTASLEFYTKLGMEPVGEAVNGQQFLQYNPSTKPKKWQSLILLKEDKDMPERKATTDAGMTRLCILADGIETIAQELQSKHGIKPIGPMASDTGLKCIVFNDPDGFVVYVWLE